MKQFDNVDRLILVTGATGKTGRAVVTRLLQKGQPVRAVVRKIDARSRRLQKAGAEIVVADLYDYEQITRALKGTKRAYFCPPVQPFMIHAASVFAVAAQEAGLEYIVGLSQWLANPQHPSLHTRQLWLVENLFSTLPGISHTVVNPGAFADTVLAVSTVA
jgi:NAD(P)H dehydrogenase (quinone)